MTRLVMTRLVMTRTVMTHTYGVAQKDAEEDPPSTEGHHNVNA